MKKLTLLTVTALTLLCVGGQAITTHAAVKGMQSFSNGNQTVFTYKLGCNAQNIMDMMESCLPNISFPDCNNSGTNKPDDNLPEINIPDNKPGNGGNGSTEENLPGEHAFAQEVVNLVNEERAKEGLPPLKIDIKVQAAAMVRAEECEEHFSHTRPDGSNFATALKEQNVSYRSAGENIAYGQRTPEEVMKAWMNSSGHQTNIMNANYTTIGVGYYENSNGTDYWCQLFTR